MASEDDETEIEDRVVTLCHVDPGFYKKILSRNSSLRSSNRVSVYHEAPGEVPFNWETQPGKPREELNVETVPPIRLPPAVHGLNMPKPRFRHPGPMACFSKYIKKLKMIKNKELRFPPAVPSFSMPKPKVSHMLAKVKLLKVKKIKNILIGKKIHPGKKSKAKPVETNGYASCTDESDGCPSCIIDGDFTPSMTHSNVSGSSWSSSVSSNRVEKSPNKMRFWSLLKKRKIIK